jgi:hypothetical protein
MKIVEKKIYVCEMCGRTSSSEEKIKECQASHQVIGDDVQMEYFYGKGKRVPKSVKFIFSDGTVALYEISFEGKPERTGTK